MNRILIVVDHKENQRLLVDCLKQQYEVSVANDAADFTRNFDCIIVDGVSVVRYAADISTCRRNNEPHFLPVLLITSRQTVTVASHQLWQLIDELVYVPIDKTELLVRIAILLRARNLSVALGRANVQLQQQIGERQQAEKALEQSLASATEMYDIGRRLVDFPTPEAILHTLLLSAKLQSVHYATLHIFTPAEDGDSELRSETLVNVRSDDISSEMMSLEITTQPFFSAGRLLRSPLFIENVELDERLSEELRHQLLAQNTHSLLTFALDASNNWYGLVELHSRVASIWNASDLDYLQHLIEQVAVVLDNVRLLQAEIKARQLAEQADKQKLEFLAMISHELRTPLASIKGFATTLLAEDVSFSGVEQRYFMTIIDEETNKLNNLVSQLLDLSRIQAGMLSITKSVHSVNEVIADASPQLHTLTIGHHFSANIPSDLPLVMVDVERLSVVLTNLVGNSVKYSPMESTIALHAYVDDEEQNIVFEVTDEGVGIPVEERTNVFEAFRQLDQPQKQYLRGAGLGLAICKGLVEAHGGRIWIKAQPPPGTTVAFAIPIYTAAPTISH